MIGGVPAGLLLAAGAGSRMGRPKALVHDERGSWLVRGVEVLGEGGCDPVVVVLGAAPEAADLVPPGVRTVLAADWAEGMGASLRAGLAALEPDAVEQVVVTLVDLPDLVPGVVRRLVGAAEGVGPGALARAAYDGESGHPVLIGRDHWSTVRDVARGDRGARDLLSAGGVLLVECGDLAGGHDVDSLPGSPGHEPDTGRGA